MKTDAYFEIGHSHSKCDDYAVAGTVGHVGYAIISDGCTGSLSAHTDVGARLLCLIARDTLKYLTQMGNFTPENGLFIKTEFVALFEQLLLRKVSEIRALMGLEIDVFDATLIVALAVGASPFKNAGWNGTPFLVFGWGDGNFILKYKDGAVRCVTIEYNPNQPYYPSYALSPTRAALYRESMQEGTVSFTTLIKNIGNDDPRKHNRNWVNTCINRNVDSPFSRLFAENYPNTTEECPISQLIISTDGLSSFQFDPRSDQYQGNNAVFPVESVFEEAIDYKVLNGPFVQRRMQRMALLNNRKRIIHTDDLAMAAICIEN